jgi:hypothetical protein
MFLQESIPDTSRYMVMGYAIAFAVMILYVFSLYIRNRNLNRDKAALDELEKSVQPAPRAKQPGKPKAAPNKAKR